MIVDTSAVIAVLRDESDASALAEAYGALLNLPALALSYVEAGVVTGSNRDPVLSRRLDELIREIRMRIEPVTPHQARIARPSLAGFWQGTA